VIEAFPCSVLIGRDRLGVRVRTPSQSLFPAFLLVLPVSDAHLAHKGNHCDWRESVLCFAEIENVDWLTWSKSAGTGEVQAGCLFRS